MYAYKAKVLRVIDGDTIDVMVDLGFDAWKKERIRLYGINTPETRTRDLKEKKKGLAAKERLKELLLVVNDEILLKTKEKGKYGRYLGDIYIGEDSTTKNFLTTDLIHKTPYVKTLTIEDDNEIYYCINDVLVREGHAVEYFGGKR